MVTLAYDGTFEGWLTAVFEIYEYKFTDVDFSAEGVSSNMFSMDREVITDHHKAERVKQGLNQRLSAQGYQQLYQAFYSGEEKMDRQMWLFAQYVFTSKINIEGDQRNPIVWSIYKAAQKVRRESHRMKAFVRFQLTKDQLYYAMVEPDCDVLTLIAKHFANRYADQRWLIYDAKRKYGIYYDLEKVSVVEMTFHNSTPGVEVWDEKELFFQKLWQRYFGSVNIKARKNMKLHLQHMPKRYWRHLTEKQVGL
jgi:probable DNA metabolism protein